MQPVIVAIFTALLAGLAVGVQNPVAGLIGQRSTPLVAALAVHTGGALVAAAVVLLRGGLTGVGKGSVPGLGLVAGVLGVMLVASISYAIPRIGATGAVALLLLGQLSASVVLDHYGLLGLAARTIDVWRLIGLVLLGAGGWLILR